MSFEDRVAAELEKEGLRVIHPTPTAWLVGFDTDGGVAVAFLVRLPDSEYFAIAAPIKTQALSGQTLGDLTAKDLRLLMRLNSEAKLAKIEYADPLGFLASSECSVEGFTGRKLRMRLEACANLATMVEKAFADEGKG